MGNDTVVILDVQLWVEHYFEVLLLNKFLARFTLSKLLGDQVVKTVVYFGITIISFLNGIKILVCWLFVIISFDLFTSIVDMYKGNQLSPYYTAIP